VLRALEMRTDGPAPVTDPIWLTRNAVLRAGATGLFYPAVSRGAVVAAGATIGRIADFHGRTLETVLAPFAGEVMYVVDTPPMMTGEPVAMVSATGPSSS